MRHLIVDGILPQLLINGPQDIGIISCAYSNLVGTPGGMTGHLQLLDLSVNKPLKIT